LPSQLFSAHHGLVLGLTVRGQLVKSKRVVLIWYLWWNPYRGRRALSFLRGILQESTSYHNIGPNQINAIPRKNNRSIGCKMTFVIKEWLSLGGIRAGLACRIYLLSCNSHFRITLKTNALRTFISQCSKARNSTFVYEYTEPLIYLDDPPLLLLLSGWFQTKCILHAVFLSSKHFFLWKLKKRWMLPLNEILSYLDLTQYYTIGQLFKKNERSWVIKESNTKIVELCFIQFDRRKHPNGLLGSS